MLGFDLRVTFFGSTSYFALAATGCRCAHPVAAKVLLNGVVGLVFAFALPINPEFLVAAYT